MNGLEFLDLVIGLIFIYLIYSIACSTLWEIILNILQLKSGMLKDWILENFKKGKLGDEIIEHPLIQGVSSKTFNFFRWLRLRKSKNAEKIPTYISSETFSDVLMELIVSKDSTGRDPKDYKFNLDILKNSFIKSTSHLDEGLKRVFLQYIEESEGKIEKFREKIGRWYDEAQERLIGSYKKYLQIWIFVFATILVGITNADTFNLVTYLHENPKARQAIADRAVEFVNDSSSIRKISEMDSLSIDSALTKDQMAIIQNLNKNMEEFKKISTDLTETKIPLGWGIEEDLKDWKVVKKIVGLLLTVLAVSLGAPFWFDVLSRLANLRSSGKKPKSTLDEETKKDK